MTPAELPGRLAITLARARRLFDARAPRERVMLTLAAAALLWMAADRLWLSPAWTGWEQARSRLTQAQANLGQTQTDAAQWLALQSNRNTQLEAEWRTLQARAARGEISADLPGLITSGEVLPLLAQLLTTHPGLRVRGLQSLAPQPLGPAGNAPPIYRHGVELTLEGPYADLVGYLQGLENAPKKVLWGGLSLKVTQHPQVLMTLRLHTLSLTSGWMEIR